MAEGQKNGLTTESPIPSRHKIGRLREEITEMLPQARISLQTTPSRHYIPPQVLESSAIGIAADLVRQRAEGETDELTQLLNRQGIERIMRLEQMRGQRLGYRASVAVVDLNGLKYTNDQKGHLAGDKLLKKAADALRLTSREVDYIARYGGDEFLVLLLGTDQETAKNWVKRVKRAMQKKRVSASIGVADFDLDDTEGSIKKADEEMYIQKALYKTNRELRRYQVNNG